MKNTLVFGASLKPNRYSNRATLQLIAKNVPTVAFGNKAGEIGTVIVKNNPSDFKNIHTVTLYLNPANQKQYYATIIALKPSRVIFNPGTENPEFYEMLRSNDIVVDVACTLVLLGTGQY